MRQIRSLKPLKLEARANAASAQVVEPVPVREILEAPAAVVTGTDELVPVRVMSSATSRFAKCNDSLGCGRRQQRMRFKAKAATLASPAGLGHSSI
jgi:hypothetical protein